MDTSAIISVLLLLFLSSRSVKLPKDVVNSKERAHDVIMTYDPRNDVHYSGTFTSSYVALVNSSFEMLPKLKSSSIIERPTLIKIQISHLDDLIRKLLEVAMFLESSEASWNPKIFLLVDSTNLSYFKELINLQSISSHSILNNIDIHSQVYIIFGEETKEWTAVYEIYTVKQKLLLNGVKTKWQGLRIEIDDTSVMRRKNLGGILIKGVTQDDQTLSLVARFEEDKEEAKFSGGVSVAYFQMMAEGLNFRVGAVRGTGWISQGPNGTLLGMAQQLLNQDADILIAFSEFLPYRMNGLRYLHPYYRTTVRAFFQQPPPNQIRNIFFHPLQPQLWFSLLILWIFTSTSLKYAYRFKRKNISKRIRKNGKTSSNDESGSKTYISGILQRDSQNDKVIARDAYMWGIASACGQGWHMIPQCGAMKLIMLSGLITYIFWNTAYSAAVVTSLSVFLDPIKTWRDLNASGYKIYGDALLHSSASIANKFLSKGLSTLVPNNQTMGVKNALQRMSKNEPIAIISVMDQFYQIASKSDTSSEFLCDKISQVSVRGAVVLGGMIVSKSSSFRKLFNYQTIMIQERGLDTRLSHQFRSEYTPICVQKKPYSLEKYILGINDVITAFGILFCAVVVSSFILACERVKFDRKTQCQIPVFHAKCFCLKK